MAVNKPTEEDRKRLEKTAAAKTKAGAGGSAATMGFILEEAGLVSNDMIRGLIPEEESAQTLKHAVVSQGLASEGDILDGRFWPPAERVKFDDFERLFPGGPADGFDVKAFGRKP